MTGGSDKNSNSSKKRSLNSLVTNSQNQSKDENDSRSKKTRIHLNYEPVVTDLQSMPKLRFGVSPAVFLLRRPVQPQITEITGERVR